MSIVLDPVVRLKRTTRLSFPTQKRLDTFGSASVEDQHPDTNSLRRADLLSGEYHRARKRKDGSTTLGRRGSPPDRCCERLGLAPDPKGVPLLSQALKVDAVTIPTVATINLEMEEGKVLANQGAECALPST